MIIGDSSALVALATMDRLNLLEQLFHEVYVPKAVYDELIIEGKPQSDTLKHFLCDKVITVNLTLSQIGLGQGELEAITLYQQLDADFLLIDDKRAKDFAKLNEINVIGSLGVLLLAKERGLLTSLRDDLEKLSYSNLFISPKLIKSLLASES